MENDLKISAIEKSVIESYRNLGGINHLNGPNLPSRKVVIDILEIFESLIFPGFQEEDQLEDDLIAFTTGAKIRRLARGLTVEIARSMEYRARSLGKTIPPKTCRKKAKKIAIEMLTIIPRLRELAMEDVKAAYQGDPAAKTRDEIILSYPGTEAITCHRIAHELHLRDVPLIPRMISRYVQKQTGIDIHPGAKIGTSFFIDHATGVVIGETAEIGTWVKLYQGVTIGALSVEKELAGEKRHPTIEDNVTIYAGATILGGNTVIGKNSVIGGNVWITKSIPPNSIVYNKPANYKMRPRNEIQSNSAAGDWII